MSADLRTRILAFIAQHADGSRDDAARDQLLAELNTLQAREIEAYRRYLASEPRRSHALGAPALPTDVFRFARVSRHPAEQDIRVFRTSGTTGATRGEHHFADLTLYDRGAEAAARYALFPDVTRMRLCILAATQHEVPDSSLSYMLARFLEWFGDTSSTYAWSEARLSESALLTQLTAAERDQTPIALLGTSFAFVHAEDALGNRRFTLPPGSRIMQTGGFKGRSRSIDPAAMLDLLSARYGIPTAHIVQEYGMTELSSQLYETPLRASVLNLPAPERRLWCPPWVRAQPVDPETFEPVPAGSPGLLRIDDLANIGSVCALQTSDLATQSEAGLLLLGRAAGAVARGCSLAVDEWMEAARATP
jgi:hypothetical protein